MRMDIFTDLELFRNAHEANETLLYLLSCGIDASDGQYQVIVEDYELWDNEIKKRGLEFAYAEYCYEMRY